MRCIVSVGSGGGGGNIGGVSGSGVGGGNIGGVCGGCGGEKHELV